VTRILGFVVQAACEDSAWLNLLQYAVPILATYFALRSVFRQKVRRGLPVRPRIPAMAAGA